MKENFQFVFHANSASPNFDRSDSVVALEEWQFAVGGQISSDHAQLHGDRHTFFNTMQPQRALDLQLRHTFLLRHGANSGRSELDLRVSGRVKHLVPEHGRLNVVAILFRFSRIATTFSRPCSGTDRKSTRLNSSHQIISYAVFCLNKKTTPLNSSHQIISYALFYLKRK